MVNASLEAPARPSPLQRWLPPLLIVAAVVGVYAWQWDLEWKFDDISAIQHNFSIRSLSPGDLDAPADGPPGLGVDRSSTTPSRSTTRSAASIRGAISSHNRLLHLGSALLLYGLTRRVLRRGWVRRQLSLGLTGAAWAAAGLALLWALHPIQTETVVYATQRTEALVSFFMLLTLYLGLRAYGSAKPEAWITGATVACALAMGSKEVAVVTPPARGHA